MTERLADFLRSDNTGGMFYGWRLVVIGLVVILVGRELGRGIDCRSLGAQALRGCRYWSAVASCRDWRAA